MITKDKLKNSNFSDPELNKKWDEAGARYESNKHVSSSFLKGRAYTDERKKIFVQELLDVWMSVPVLRFGQLLSNAFDGLDQDMWGQGIDEYFRREIFNMEDKDFLLLLMRFRDAIEMDTALK